MKLRLAAAAAIVGLTAVHAVAQTTSPNIAAAVADAGRPEKDTKLDASRHPAEMAAFARIMPG